MRQLLLNILLRDDATFENFYAGKNQAVLDYLKSPQENLIYLYAKPNSGLTHILQALCKINPGCFYIPLEKISEFQPEILEDLDGLDLIIIDDLEKITGNSPWENKLFNLYNQIVDHKKRLILASHYLPQNLDLKLLDLKSRLQAMLLLTLEELKDPEKISALQLRAKNRGIILKADVAQFLLNHAPRDMTGLMGLISQLDQISLQEKRRLTIPLAKEILDKVL